MRKSYFAVLACLMLLFTLSGQSISLAACTPPAKIVGGESYTPTSIQDAYDYASITLGMAEFTLQLSGEIFSEDLFIDRGSVTLDGGYDCSFTSKTGAPTGIYGTLAVSSGAANFASDIAVVSTDKCDFDRDLDGFTSLGSCLGSADDCNDLDPDISPGASELCDGIDNNCDGQIDEGFAPVDADADGYFGFDACGVMANDCNDADATIHPDALDTPYDGIDQDCNGADLNFDSERCLFCHTDQPPSAWPGLHDLTTVPDTSCAGCHAPIVTSLVPGHYGRTVLTDGNAMTAGMVIGCESCHDPNNSFHNWGTNTVWPKVLAATPDISCDTCHENRAAGHVTETAHDNRLSDALCGACHTSGNVAEVDALHRSDCTLCHNYTGTAVNPQTVREVILQGVTGTPVGCNDCHNKGDDHLDHDHSATISGSTDCVVCHNHSAPQIVEVIHNNGCALCHSSTRPEVEAAIDSGQAECIDCHTAHDGPAAHNNLSAPESCAVCHTDKVTGTDFSYIINNHGPHPTLGYTELDRCQRCHSSTDPVVIDTIAAGKGEEGIPVTCVNCHENQHVQIITPSEIHNFILTGTGSNCYDCHIENYWSHTDMIATGDCATCHASTNQDEYNALHQNDCLICHLTPRVEVITAINNGVAGTPVECIDCHTSTWETIHTTAPDHSGIVTTGDSSCANCHDDILIDSSSSTHSSCTNCHDAITGLLISLAAGKTAPGDCTSCHGSDLQVTHPSCSNCHETPPSGFSSPNNEGAHFEHDVIGFGTTEPSCIACHEGLNHNNGTVDVAIAANFNALSGPASSDGSTCANTSCHGGQTTPDWTAGTIDVNTDCTLCHALGTTQYNSYNSGKHWKHTSVVCTDCHSIAKLETGHFTNLETPTFEQNPAETIGGIDTEVGSYDGIRCSNISCHMDKGW